MKQHPITAARLTESELDQIRMLIENRSAILFDSSRERFFSTHVREYLAEKGLASGNELLGLIRGSSIEYEALLETLLTQETSFFRYPAVYEALETKILPEVQERKFWENPRTLRIWSAGCSTGEEPYSIAITLCESLKFAEAWEIEILATDISRRALRHAEKRRVFQAQPAGSLARTAGKLFHGDEARLPREATHSPDDFVRADEPVRVGLRRQDRRHLLHERAHVFFRGAAPGDPAPFL